MSAPSGCADARAVTVGVLNHPVRRRTDVAHQAPPSVEDSLEPMLGFVLRDPYVEVPTLLELLFGERQRLIGVVWGLWGCPGSTDGLIMPPPGGGVVGSVVRIRRV